VRIVFGPKGKEGTVAAQRRGRRVLRLARGNPETGVSGHGAYRVRGQGNYFTDAGSDGTSLVNKGFNAAGRGLANAVGLPSLAGAAGSAGSWLSRVLGFGAYQVKKNTVCSNGFSNMSASGGPDNIPEFGSTASRGSIRVRHREFITDILSSTGFSLQNYLIHAGNTALWPWLAQLSQNFEEAKIHGCLFEYKPTSAYAVAGTQAMGNVIMATDYDVVDANYINKREMEIVEFSSSAMSNTVQIHPIECDPRTNVLAEHYITYGATTVAAFPDDPRFGCLGNFQIATNGMPTAGQAVGELWVTYDIELIKPQLASNIANAPEFHLYGATPAATSPPVVVGNSSAGYPAAPVSWTMTGSTAATSGAVLTCVLPGSYLILASQASAGGSASPFAPSVAGGAGFVSVFSTSTGNHSYGWTNQENASGSITPLAVTFSAAGQTVNVPLPGSASYITYWDIIITPFNTSVGTRRRAETSLDKKLKERDELSKMQAERLAIIEKWAQVSFGFDKEAMDRAAVGAAASAAAASSGAKLSVSTSSKEEESPVYIESSSLSSLRGLFPTTMGPVKRSS